MSVVRPGFAVYDICRLQTADRRPQTADCRPQTADCRLHAGAPNEGVPQNICSALEIQLASKIFIFIDFGWELRTFQVQLAGTEGNTGRLDKKLVQYIDINFHKAISVALD